MSAIRPQAQAALRAIRYEVIPTATIAAKVREHVPQDVTITVTASPAKGLDTTIELALELAHDGYAVVPHISTRLLRDRDHLEKVVSTLTAVGIQEIFMPAGDADPPAGIYHAALPALVDLAALGSPFARVGVTGYPESHPTIDDDVTVQAMWDKRELATCIVSNLCFDPAQIVTWMQRVRRRGVTLPIHLGLAGPVELTKLVSMAGKVGVGESARFLTQHTSWFARMLKPGYSPERLLDKVSSQGELAGVHLFTFNQVGPAEEWRQKLLAG